MISLLKIKWPLKHIQVSAEYTYSSNKHFQPGLGFCGVIKMFVYIKYPWSFSYRTLSNSVFYFNTKPTAHLTSRPTIKKKRKTMDLLKVFGWIWLYFEKSSYFIAVNIIKLATYLTDVQPIARTHKQTRAPYVAGERERKLFCMNTLNCRMMEKLNAFVGCIYYSIPKSQVKINFLLTQQLLRHFITLKSIGGVFIKGTDIVKLISNIRKMYLK